AIPPPSPVSPLVSSSAVLPETTVLFSVAAAWLSRPPPLPPGALFPVIWLSLLTSVPPLATPPPPLIGPAVAVLSLITLLFSVIRLGAPPPIPLPPAIPPPPGPVLWSTVLLFRVSVEAKLTMPPPPIASLGTVFQLTSLLFRVATAPKPLAIPPPACAELLPVTSEWFSVSVPLLLKMP